MKYVLKFSVKKCASNESRAVQCRIKECYHQDVLLLATDLCEYLCGISALFQT